MPDDLSGDLDPQIAELLGLTGSPKQESKPPDFSTLIGETEPSTGGSVPTINQKSFQKITQLTGTPDPYFRDKNFYKRVLHQGGEVSRRVHEMLTAFLNTHEASERSQIRGRLIAAFWELNATFARQVRAKLPHCKLLCLRFGLLSPTLISPEQQDLLSRVINKNTTKEPVYYLDEWLSRVASGLERPSATDELKPVKRDAKRKMLDNLERTRGQRTTEMALLQNRVTQRNELERQLASGVQTLRDHSMSFAFEGIPGPYAENQLKLIPRLNETLRRLSSLDKDIQRSINTLRNIRQKLANLEDKTGSLGVGPIDDSVIEGEFNSVRQMAKLCVGRKGNHLPILMKNYLRSDLISLGIRENVINIMAEVEEIDEGLFYRTFRNQRSRIVPNILLLPNYGEQGICWEPFERLNRASSRGRIALPLYPRDLKLAVISALGDLRWQVAKEKAQHYWMEEGITGRYYSWFQGKRLKGDVRMAFIKDYILWVTKESQGMQKLDREVRGIFWRMMPFPQKIKDDLKNRGFVYNELYKKDVNISKSDGY